jgi:hypothetical protein
MPNPVHGITEATDLLIDVSVDDDLSEALNLAGRVLTGIHMPISWTAASLTFWAAKTADGTYRQMYDADGNAVGATVAASQYIAIDPTNFLGVRHMKIGTSVGQAADRTLTLELGRAAIT